MFKRIVNLLLTYFTPCSNFCIVNFEQVNACWANYFWQETINQSLEKESWRLRPCLVKLLAFYWERTFQENLGCESGYLTENRFHKRRFLKIIVSICQTSGWLPGSFFININESAGCAIHICNKKTFSTRLCVIQSNISNVIQCPN